MDIRQSKIYAEFMTRLGWKVERVGKWHAFIKNFPLLGSFIKIQRIKEPIPWDKIKELAGKHRAFRVLLEPDVRTPRPERPWPLLDIQSETPYRKPKTAIYPQTDSPGLSGTGVNHRTWNIKPRTWKRTQTLYLPTKTVHINLTRTEKEIFNGFSKETRWAVRRGRKNELKVVDSDDIDSFIKLKSKQMFPLGFLIKKEIQTLLNSFNPDNSTILLAHHLSNSNCLSEAVAGVLLLFFRKKAYYWLATTTTKGKKLSAPSLLVWEAIKLAKRKGCRIFDFEGIYDERFPKATKNWPGFTKFKRGFGGKTVEYPLPLTVAKPGR